MKPEQAPKVPMWTPTRRRSGEGRTDREEPGAGARSHDNHRALVRSTGVVGTALGKGSQRQSGKPERSRVATADVAGTGGGPIGCRRGSEVPLKPGNAGGGKDPCF